MLSPAIQEAGRAFDQDDETVRGWAPLPSTDQIFRQPSDGWRVTCMKREGIKGCLAGGNADRLPGEERGLEECIEFMPIFFVSHINTKILSFSSETRPISLKPSINVANGVLRVPL